MPIYKFAFCGWLALTALSIAVAMPYFATMPTLYMLPVAYLFRTKFPDATYQNLNDRYPSVARKLAASNMIFVVSAGFIGGLMEGWWGTLY